MTPTAIAPLAGESCIPGIAASNLEAIFEEHVISGSLDPFSSVNNEFGLREKVFNLGAVVADLAEGSRGGVRANLKFINPIKVPCTVDFSIKPRGTFPPGACQAPFREWSLPLAAMWVEVKVMRPEA